MVVTLRAGPYGVYVQLGNQEDMEAIAASAKAEAEAEAEAEADAVDEKTKKKTKPKKAKKLKVPKPKRSSLPKGMDPDSVDLERALKLLALPREVGLDPESGEMILAGIGRFGPYLKYGDKYQSLGADDSVLEIGLNRAVVVIAEGKNKKGRGRSAGKDLGKHPNDSKTVTIKDGRFGPYVQHGSLRATLPRDKDKDAVTLEDAIALLEAKAAKTGTKKKKPAKKKVTAKKKTIAKKKASTKKRAPAALEAAIAPIKPEKD